MLRVVIDTNTFISGIFWEGNEAKIVYNCIDEVIENYTTPPIIIEIERVLGYKKFGLTNQEIERFLQIYISFSNIISPEKGRKIPVRDITDIKFIECAISADVDYIISGDDDLLELGDYNGIKIIRSMELLNILN